MTNALDGVRNQINNIIKTRYPHLPSYAINDEALKSMLKDHKGDIDSIATEVVKIIISRNKIKRKIKLI